MQIFADIRRYVNVIILSKLFLPFELENDRLYGSSYIRVKHDVKPLPPLVFPCPILPPLLAPFKALCACPLSLGCVSNCSRFRGVLSPVLCAAVSDLKEGASKTPGVLYPERFFYDCIALTFL